MNIKNQSLEPGISNPSDFIEGCKKMSAEASFVFRQILRKKFNVSDDKYLNECTKDFVKLLLS